MFVITVVFYWLIKVIFFTIIFTYFIHWHLISALLSSLFAAVSFFLDSDKTLFVPHWRIESFTDTDLTVFARLPHTKWKVCPRHLPFFFRCQIWCFCESVFLTLYGANLLFSHDCVSQHLCDSNHKTVIVETSVSIVFKYIQHT